MHALRRIGLAPLALVLWAGVALAAPPPDYGLLDGVRAGQTLRRGASGPAVAALQNALTAAGHPVTATGFFGPVTEGRARALQAATGCAVDGVVGRETLSALDRVLGATPAATPPPATTPPATTAPARLRRLRNAEVTRAITAEAVRILREHRAQPIGFEVPFTADGKAYVARIELHYHPPGGPARPWGPHKGVSVFAVVPAV